MAASGTLRHQAVLEAPTRHKGATGGFTTTWATVFPVRAEILNMGARVVQVTKAGGGEVKAVAKRFRIRYRAGVTADMRVVYAGAHFSIIDVEDVDEAHSWLVLSCEAGVKHA